MNLSMGLISADVDAMPVRRASRRRYLKLVLAGLGGVVSHITAARAEQTPYSAADEQRLCGRLEDVFGRIRSVKREQFERAYAAYVERLCLLVLVAEAHANGSQRLDAIFTRIQREVPLIAVPYYILRPSEVQQLLEDMAADGARDAAFQKYLKRHRYLSQLINEAKRAIAGRSGFRFDPSAPVRYAQ